MKSVEVSMHISRSDRVVKGLSAFLWFACHFFRLLAVVVLVALPLIKAFDKTDGGFYYGLHLPIKAATPQTTIQTAWGEAPLVLDEVRGKVKLPIRTMPWSLVGVLWGYTAVAAALMLMFLHNLRRIIDSVRDGAAFDAQNVLRLRTLGTVMLAGAGLNTIAELLTSTVVRRGLAAGSNLTVPNGFHVDGALVFVALVVITLAEVFRRGAELEHEQSLVV